MKFKTSLSLFLFVFTLFSSYSQSCFPEGISFTTQSEIDDFLIDYPDCTSIEGDLIIDGLDISSLLPLANITNIDGNLLIGTTYYSSSGSPLLTSLNGLDNLISVGGWLDIEICTELINLEGLGALESIEEGLIIIYNQNLTSLSGLENLSTLNGPVYIVWNDSLTSIDALSSVETSEITDLSIFSNTSLSNCNITLLCSYLESPNGVINIYSNGDGCDSPSQIAENCFITLPCLPFGNYYFLSQEDVDYFSVNFPNCSNLQGQVIIRNGDITNLSGLNQITSINGALTLQFVSNLTALNGLHNLDFISGTLNINGNNSLNDISALSNIVSDSLVDLLIHDNTSLSICSINSICNYLDNINGTISIYDNNVGCNNPSQISDSCNINLECLPYGDYYLTSQQEIDDFSINYPDCTELNGIIKISGDDITNLDGLSQITSISDRLDIAFNPLLNDISGLENLTHIGNTLVIWINDILEDLSPLENLTFVGESIRIISNDSLESLSGLDNVNSDSLAYIRVQFNPSLSMCSILSLCNYLEIDSADYDISNNLDNCNSGEEITQLCVNDIQEYSKYSFFNIYPNPSSSILTIESKDNKIIDEVIIFNQLGQILLQQESYSGSIDISELNPGNYILEIISNNLSERKIFIVQK